ncbi:MAG: response regulator [Spirochaetia bacterium]|nr:response regulator [Spirochaetia bacterium]
MSPAAQAVRTLLLVEDNPNDELLTLRALKKNNILNPVVVARDGVAALEVLFPSDGSTPTYPSLILLDLKIPKINGLEVLKRIRSDARTKLLPVVILTSSIEEKDLVEGYSLGVNSYIRKPVEFDRFIQAVSQLGVYWLSTNELPPQT